MFIHRTISRVVKKFCENGTTSSMPYCFLKIRKYQNARTCLHKHFSTASDEYTNINFDEITQGDKELEHKLKVLALETEVMRQDGKLVPENSYLKTTHWQELMTMSSRSARQKYLEYLFKLSQKDAHKKAKSEERRKGYEEYLARREKEKAIKPTETLEEFVSKHDLQHNNIFLRFYDTTINQLYNNRLIQAMKFGQKLVVDIGYDANMTKRENLNCAKQLMLLFAENRAHDDPFDLHFCNANKQSVLMRQFNKFIPTLEEPWFPLNLHECSYLDIFPKDQLVYLTPHCREEIKEYDHDAVYIIGAIVDKVNQEPLSLAKAKREGIKMAKLPLDRYLQWGAGSGKSLTLNQVASILLDQKVGGDWQQSFRHVPRRKLLSEENTIKAIDRVYSRKRENSERKRWSPSFNNVKFDKLKFNRNVPKETNSVDNKIDVKKYFNE